MGNKGSKKGVGKGKLLKDAQFKEIVQTGYDDIVKASGSEGTLQTFTLALIANNQEKPSGGLGSANFHKIFFCGLSKDQLLGKSPVSKDEFVTFYTKAAGVTPRLKYDETLKESLDCVAQFYKQPPQFFQEKMSALLKFFDTLDKDKNGNLDKKEVVNFYNNVQDGKYNGDDDVAKLTAEEAIKWVDRNGDGVLTIWELVSFTFSGPLLKRTLDSWYEYLDSIGLNVKGAQ